MPNKHFSIHIDLATVEKTLVRISFSNSFKEFKSTPTWLQFPYVIQAPNDTVYEKAELAAKDLSGAAPPITKWTVLCLDLLTLTQMYTNRSYECVRGFKLCAGMFVKNVLTSDMLYEPGVNFAEARLKQPRVNAFPRELSFPYEKSDQWSRLYDFVTFPSESFRKPFDSVGQSRVLVSACPSNDVSQPKRVDVKQVFTSGSSSTSVISHTAIDALTFKSRRPNTAPNFMSLNLPLVGVPQDDDYTRRSFSGTKAGLNFVSPEDALKQNELDIHVYPGNKVDSLSSSLSSLLSLDGCEYSFKTNLIPKIFLN